MGHGECMTTAQASNLIEVANRLSQREDHISQLLAGLYYDRLRQWSKQPESNTPEDLAIINCLPPGYRLIPH